MKTDATKDCRYLVHYSGDVQGVGFRQTAQRIAMRHPVTGFVRNLPDCRVELVAEGDSEAVRSFYDEVAEALAKYIKDADLEVLSATNEYSAFEIRYYKRNKTS